MGLRYRKSFKLAPGVRMTVSKSGLGYSVGRNGMRVTKSARGGLSSTVGLPGSGLRYTTNLDRSAASQHRAAGSGRGPLPETVNASLRASRYAARQVPTPRRVQIERALVLIGLVLTIAGMAAAPLLVLAVPILLVALIMSLINVKADLRWARERRAARLLAPGDPCE